jgi:hypothetical protein
MRARVGRPIGTGTRVFQADVEHIGFGITVQPQLGGGKPADWLGRRQGARCRPPLVLFLQRRHLDCFSG